MKSVHWIDLGQWPCRLAFVATQEGFDTFAKKFSGDLEPGYPRQDAGCVYKLKNSAGDSLFLLAIGPASHPNERFCTLAHEAVHVMQFVLKHVGEDHPGIETEAYLVECVLRQCLKALRD